MSSSDKENPAREAYGDAADVEKQMPIATDSPDNDHSRTGQGFANILAVKDGEVYDPNPEKRSKWYQRLVDAGFEENGIKPVPLEQRTNTQYSNLFTLFFTSMMSLLP